MAKAYFLRDSRYLLYDTNTDTTDSGYPKSISDGWSNLPADFRGAIDTALDLADGRVYLFRGVEYVRVDQWSNAVDPGYPLPITGFWPGLAEAGFAGGIDAAVNWGNGKAYFFKNGNYIRYDLAADTVDTPVQPIAGNWPGLAEAGFADRIDAAWVKLEPRPGSGTATSGDEHGGWTRVHDELHVGGTLAWRNNNPGNLLPGTMPYRNALAIDRRGLAIFASYEDGWTALRDTLRSRTYSPLTMAEALEKYAPAGHGGNDPVLYADRVRQLTGLDPDRRVGDLNDAELERFMQAIKAVEGFEEGRTFHRGDPGLPPELAGLLG